MSPDTWTARGHSVPDVVEKPTTYGAAETREPDMVEKPTTFGAAETREPDVDEKPTTFVAAKVRGMDVLDAGPEQPYGTRDKNRQPKGGTRYMLQKEKL